MSESTLKPVRVCSVDGCEKTNIASRGLCEAHYAQRRRAGTLGPKEPKPPRPCTVEGCEGVQVGREVCMLHYKRLNRTGSVADPVRKRAVPSCKKPKCSESPFERSLCESHFRETERPTDIEGERWLPVVGFEGLYEVSDHGRLYRVPSLRTNGKLLASKGRKNGYRATSLVRADGAIVSKYIHALVLEAFVGPRPEGMYACHWDDVPTNNVLSNLRRDTPKANTHDAIRNGKHPAAATITHCKSGHPWDLVNTEYDDRGGRHCRTCRDRNTKRSGSRSARVRLRAGMNPEDARNACA